MCGLIETRSLIYNKNPRQKTEDKVLELQEGLSEYLK